ncbi:MAG: phosphotransferase [Deltaproteobacteria bacterium]|nr:phosphotransferase [Deltaproteobacteria bacterium]
MHDADWKGITARVLKVASGKGPDPLVTPLVQDASTRSYFRATLESGRTVVVMKMAPDPLKSDELVVGARPDKVPFLDVGRYLAGGGIPVPEVLHVNLDAGVIVLEDLGDVTIERALADGADKMSLYLDAVDLMAAMEHWASESPDPDCIAFKRGFGPKLLRWELEHFHEWCLIELTGRTPTSGEKEALNAFYDQVVRMIADLPTGFVHRDFQSRNLMVHEGRLRLIDFQDALEVPYLYDLVALLRDSYVAFDATEVDEIQRAFIEARKQRGMWTPSESDLKKGFQVQALQRKLKDAGRFVYIDRVRKNPRFLCNIPRSLSYAPARQSTTFLNSAKRAGYWPDSCPNTSIERMKRGTWRCGP